MTLHAALAPIEDCTAPFRVGAELEVGFWLSAIHIYDHRNRTLDPRAFDVPELPSLLHQPSGTTTRPNLTFLRSRVTSVKPDERPKEERVYGPSRTILKAIEPLELDIGFRRLQQGGSSIPGDVGQSIAALGFLGVSAHAKERPSRVRVEAILVLDLEPLSPTFGTWRNDEVWIEGAVDVSNLNETTVIARLTVLRSDV